MSIYTGPMNPYFLFSLGTLERIGKWGTEIGRTPCRDTMWRRQVVAHQLWNILVDPLIHTGASICPQCHGERVVSSTSRNGWCILKRGEALSIYNSVSWTNMPERKWGQKSERIRNPNQGQPRNSRTIVLLTHSSFLPWDLTVSFTRWLNS